MAGELQSGVPPSGGNANDPPGLASISIYSGEVVQPGQQPTMRPGDCYGAPRNFASSGSGPSPRVASGAVASGQIATMLFSGVVASGAYSPNAYDRFCAGCGKLVGSFITSDQVIVTGVSGLHIDYCWGCAGFLYQPYLRFRDAGDLLREITGLPNTTPWGVAADYLEDRLRLHEQAAQLRRLRSGRLNDF